MDLIGFLIQNEMYFVLVAVFITIAIINYRQNKKDNREAIDEIKKVLQDHVKHDDKVHTGQNEKIQKIEVEQAEQNLKIHNNKEDIIELKGVVK